MEHQVRGRARGGQGRHPSHQPRARHQRACLPLPQPLTYHEPCRLSPGYHLLSSYALTHQPLSRANRVLLLLLLSQPAHAPHRLPPPLVLQEVDLAVSYGRAMENRHLGNRHNLTIIDPAEIVLQRIIGTSPPSQALRLYTYTAYLNFSSFQHCVPHDSSLSEHVAVWMVAGEGSFGRVWRATWRSSDVAVKEFFFRQSALSTDASQKAVSDQLPPTSVHVWVSTDLPHVALHMMSYAQVEACRDMACVAPSSCCPGHHRGDRRRGRHHELPQVLSMHRP